MKTLLRSMIPLAVMVGLAMAVVAQDAPPSPPPDLMAQEGPMGHGPGGPGFHHMELLGVGGPHGGKVVTGAPFTAVAVTTFSHTLADGNKISKTNQTNLYRDSQGRFRRDGTMPFGADLGIAQPHSFVMIHDPVAAKGYLLNPDKKVAHVRSMDGRGRKGMKDGKGEASDTIMHGGPDEGDSTNPNVTKESLGTQTINGISAQGTRFTRTIPAGTIGNDKAITVTREVWYSPDLQIVVQSKHSDPRFGDTTYTLTNIQRTEPAANLFTVPADYTIKEAPEHHGPIGRMRGQMPPSSSVEAPPAPGA